MTDDATQVDPTFRRNVLLKSLIGPGTMLAIIWIMFLLNALFGVDVTTWVSRRANREPMSVLFSLVLAAIFTPIILGYGWFVARKALGLVDHGVEVTGRVTSIGKISQHGSVPLRYSYVFRNVAYSGAVDMQKAEAQKLRDEGKVRLLVNSRNPGQSDLYENIRTGVPG